ncbi:G-protein-signaling modulator 1-like [Arapaima gigas]
MELSAEAVDVRDFPKEVEHLEPLFIFEEGDELEWHGANSRTGGGGEHSFHVHRELGENINRDGECGGGNKEAETEDSVEETCRMGEAETQEGTDQVRKKEPVQECEEKLTSEGRREDEVNIESETAGSRETKLEENLGASSNSEPETEAKCGDIQAEVNSEKEQTARGADAEKDEARKSEKLEKDVGTQHLDQHAPKLRCKDTLSPPGAQKQMRRLTPDFPDSLYELLCSIQEGRRLNDQRCSFGPERRCHSEPSTPVPRHKVIFSSMTSLQKEEFFDLLATSQGRRLDDQRAELHSPSSPEACQVKVNKKKNSIKRLEPKAAAAKAAPKEDLYNMILTSQAQGRLEDQRSAPPCPMDDEDFFSLLLKVQGGRMDEQRTELPMTLRY